MAFVLVGSIQGGDEAFDDVAFPDEDTTSWSERMDAALEVARQYSGFSKFHETYPPLFSELWDAWVVSFSYVYSFSCWACQSKNVGTCRN